MRSLEHFPNLVAMFFTRASEQGDKPFLWTKPDGQWRSTSWREAADIVSQLAAGAAAARG
jgi:long-chain acyl-CoA synthetase